MERDKRQFLKDPNLTPEEKRNLLDTEWGRESFAEYLKDAAPDSAKILAFSDEVDLQKAHAEELKTGDSTKQDEVYKKIHQHRREVEGYTEERRHVMHLSMCYLTLSELNEIGRELGFGSYNHWRAYANGLMKIRNQLLSEKSGKSSTPPKK